MGDNQKQNSPPNSDEIPDFIASSTNRRERLSLWVQRFERKARVLRIKSTRAVDRVPLIE